MAQQSDTDDKQKSTSTLAPWYVGLIIAGSVIGALIFMFVLLYFLREKILQRILLKITGRTENTLQKQTTKRSEPHGACRYQINNSKLCVNKATQSNCEKLQGEFSMGQGCEPKGACYSGDSKFCINLTKSQCDGINRSTFIANEACLKQNYQSNVSNFATYEGNDPH